MAKPRPLPNPGKSASLRTVNLKDFRGGLVVRDYNSTDTGPNQLRTASNIVLQLGGGVGRRGGFNQQSTLTSVSTNFAATYHPDGSLFWVGQGPSDSYYGYSNGLVYTSLNTYKQTVAASTRYSVAAATGPNSIDFGVKSGSTTILGFIGCGASVATYANQNTGQTAMSSSNPTFQDDYGSPSGSYFPRCTLVEAHAGYMFAGVTYTAAGALESGNRFRWSHPGDAGSWRTNDYIDIYGASTILGMHSIGSQLVLVCDNGVWALSGYSPETFSLRRIHTAQGTGYSKHNGRSVDGSACFWIDSEGVWLYDGSSKRTLSADVMQPIKAATGYRNSEICQFTYHGRPHLAVPVDDGTTNGLYYVCHLDTGGWTTWTWGESGSGGPRMFAWPGIEPSVIIWDNTYISTYDINALYDNITGAATANIAASFTTGWIDGGEPAIKKTWKRPEILYRASSSCSFTINSYKDYVDTVDKTITAAQAGSGSNFEVDKLATLGPSRSVSVKVTGPTAQNVTWDIEDVVLKFRPKPLRN